MPNFTVARTLSWTLSTLLDIGTEIVCSDDESDIAKAIREGARDSASDSATG